MKIVNVEFTTYQLKFEDGVRSYSNSILNFNSEALTFVRVETDEGLTGVSLAKPPDAAFRDQIVARLLGEDPLNYASNWYRMFTGWRKRIVKGDAIAAIGAIDIALWDLRGKIMNAPVYQVLGGFRNRVPVYAAGGYYAEGKGIAELGEELNSYVAAGYRAVKIKVGGAPFKEDVARVHGAREAIGPDIGLMVDANNAWNSHEALKFARAVEDCDLAWYEEPCWPDDLDGARRLCDALDMPVASGEVEYTRWGFRDLIERGAADIIQADPCYCGGLTEWVRIAALASAHHMYMAPHGQHYLGAHAVAAVDNGLIVESYLPLRPWQDRFISGPELDNGDLVLTDAPGLGLEINFDALEQAAEPFADTHPSR